MNYARKVLNGNEGGGSSIAELSPVQISNAVCRFLIKMILSNRVNPSVIELYYSLHLKVYAAEMSLQEADDIALILLFS